MKTLDVSNHDYSTFDAPCLAASGVERLIVGCWDLEETLDMVARGRAAGIAVEDLYAFQYFGLEYQSIEVTHALAVAAQLGGIARIWVDAECSPPNEAPGLSPDERSAAVRSEVARIENAGIAAGLYTYGPYWRSQMANTTEFSRLPLWFAAYGAGGDPSEPIHEVDFGGWTSLAAHQYTSTVVVCGRRRDHNYWYLEEDMDEAGVISIFGKMFIPYLKAAFSDEPGVSFTDAEGHDLPVPQEVRDYIVQVKSAEIAPGVILKALEEQPFRLTPVVGGAP